jgi:hypothetical protein
MIMPPLTIFMFDYDTRQNLSPEQRQTPFGLTYTTL